MAITAAQAIEAVEGSDGNIGVIASRLGCTRRHVYNLRDKYVTVAEAIEEEREAFKDEVESIISQKIRDGDNTMIIFYAKTQMKERGYVERQEVSGPDGAPLQIVMDR